MLGSHIVEALLARGEHRVKIFDLAPSSLFEGEIRKGVVTFHRGDIRNREQVEAACKGADTVFHAAASVNYWADLPFEYEPIHSVNVTGTENVIAGSIAGGVRQLIATSSTTVVVPFDVVRRPLALADEGVPLASEPYLCHYIRTKGIAERAVLAADGRDGLSTAAVRPGGMYGPRDRLLSLPHATGMPSIGFGENTVDHIYVENVVHALLLLETRLIPGAPVCGRAYFVTNYPPSSGSDAYLDFNAKFAARFGRSFRVVPAPLASTLAWTSQAVVQASSGRAERALGQLRKLRPASIVLARATYYFSHRLATDHFGYEPLYTADEGMDLTATYWHRVLGGEAPRVSSFVPAG
jgi:sterol-4alpha-carboxylate 3-dehydrogenase (decarboxylating)